ncbi:MAG: 50S ribosomal protein L25/general stress protein Ctc [Gammaproteobacteria bacterium]|nr:50S ribosomal protein L25/general stress protein Ctc [Gammaproteobacteria bacterium]MBU1442613.1 50S ribosomal protein L25/general stress protein Ctc [Gammaproteobacteria bacterium]MBU2286922.1 50S ribosomal protein L25/general stress protein Ctc [Gammaproteobacteria bacterium]
MKFVAFERAKQGTGASRRLRISGKTPGIVYGGEGKPQLIELDHNALWHALKKEAFHSSILEMELGGSTSKVLLRDVQYHPFRQLVQHIDFQRVDARTRMTVKVPLHYTGEEESVAVKIDHNLVNHVMTELEISCLPADLPEFIEVDLSGLTNTATIHVNDIKLPKGVKFVSHGKNNPVLVSAVPPLVAEEVDEAAAGAEAAEGAAAAPAAGKAAAPAAGKAVPAAGKAAAPAGKAAKK